MKFVMTVLSFGLAATAQAGETFTYPVLNEYQAQAEKVLALSKVERAQLNIAELKLETQTLIGLGEEIARLYIAKNPVCAEQINTFLSALPKMTEMPLSDVNEKFHAGKGLPQAPRHCYFGRSEIVHPVMNQIRLKGELTDEMLSQIEDDFDEVIEHLSRIQKNLDNPLN
ncbi:MAG: hypothetical protein ACJ763_06485 [Bdellovibrionia bacterium]